MEINWDTEKADEEGLVLLTLSSNSVQASNTHTQEDFMQPYGIQPHNTHVGFSQTS